MVASRNRPKGVRYGPFGLSILVLSLIPKQIGYQDFMALLARQPAVSERARAHLMASPFGTIHAATFSFRQPIGTSMPIEPLTRLASLGLRDSDSTGSIMGDLSAPPAPQQHLDFPAVNRRLKGDLLVQRPRPTPPPAPSRDLTPGRVKTVSFPRPAEQPSPAYEVASLPPAALAPVELSTPGAGDPDIKRSALAPSPVGVKDDAKISPPAGGRSVAPKGEVTGADKRPKTPAERLGLAGKERAKAEKCMAEAVYFESRGEPKRGQIAVAQVVMNRTLSGFYPNTVCATVYQNANRHNACQFTFACDDVPDVVTEPDMWVQAKQIAHDMLDGKVWLPEVAYSTHYHAYWVHPSWVGEMRKLDKIGVHSFYRPRAWGNTVEVPNYPFIPPKAKL